jgi:hypothetical protein
VHSLIGLDGTYTDFGSPMIFLADELGTDWLRIYGLSFCIAAGDLIRACAQQPRNTTMIPSSIRYKCSGANCAYFTSIYFWGIAATMSFFGIFGCPSGASPGIGDICIIWSHTFAALFALTFLITTCLTAEAIALRRGLPSRPGAGVSIPLSTVVAIMAVIGSLSLPLWVSIKFASH